MDLASHPEFVKGNVDTDFITRHYDELFPKKEVKNDVVCAAVMAVILGDGNKFVDGLAVNSKLRRKIALNLPNGKSDIIFATYNGGDR